MFKVFKTGVAAAAALNAGTGADNQGKTAMEADTIQHGRSSVSQKNRGNFLWMVCFALILGVFVLSGCNKDDEPKTGEPTERYETVPYTGNGINGYSVLKSGSGLENLVFDDYDEDHNYYYFLLGHIYNVPLAAGLTLEHDGGPGLSVTYSMSRVTVETISNSVTTASEHAFTRSGSNSWNNEIGGTGTFGGETSWFKFEASYKRSWGGTDGWEQTESRSFSNTYETSRSFADETREDLNVNLDGRPAGAYRWALFSTTDVYFLIITDRNKTRIIDQYSIFCARQGANNQRWVLDYDPDKRGTFGKTAQGELLAPPNISISQLPDIEECIHEWSEWIVIEDPDPTTAGQERRTCGKCDNIETRIIPITVNLRTVSESSDVAGYKWEHPVLTISSGADIIITTTGETTNRRIVVSGTRNLTIRDLNISTDQTPILISQGANAVLTLEGINTLQAGANYAGIQTFGAVLTIDGTGSLTATGGNGGAGIGGERGEDGEAGRDRLHDRDDKSGKNGTHGNDGGEINILGGTITARGGSGGVGIGGGRGGDGGRGGHGHTTADHGNGGRGGNGGDGGKGSLLTINGGTVTAIGSNGAPGIGPGMRGNGGAGGSRECWALGFMFCGNNGSAGSPGIDGAAGTLTISPNATVTITPPQ